jgi:hypothetical protein
MAANPAVFILKPFPKLWGFRTALFKIILTGMLLKNQNFYREVEKVKKIFIQLTLEPGHFSYSFPIAGQI